MRKEIFVLTDGQENMDVRLMTLDDACDANKISDQETGGNLHWALAGIETLQDKVSRRNKQISRLREVIQIKGEEALSFEEEIVRLKQDVAKRDISIIDLETRLGEIKGRLYHL